MRKSKFTESQIVRVLKEVEGARAVVEVSREHGISDATCYHWKAKYGGMKVSDIKRLKELEEEHQQLKRMFADLSLKHEALKDIVEKSSKAGSEARTGGLCPRTGDKPEGGLSDTQSQPLRVPLPARYYLGLARHRGDPEHRPGVSGLGLPQGLQDVETTE